jgi:hypothetical protein
METTEMSRRIQIAALKSARISAEIRDALRDGIDADRIADFLAGIDWGSLASAAPVVTERLGLLEEWSTQFAEGEISEDEYGRRLSGLLPQRERRPTLASRTA